MPRPVDELVARMETMLEPLAESRDARRFFHARYLRTTRAVAAEIGRGGFQDGEWTERWDVAFAGLYLNACDAWTSGEPTPAPSRSRQRTGLDCPRFGWCSSA